MEICNVVLSTEHKGGKGGVATVIPMYIEALGKLGKTIFIPTHRGGGFSGKFSPWIFSFFRCFIILNKNRNSRIFFHLHPGSGFCIIRMLFLAAYLRYVVRQQVLIYLHTPYLEKYLKSRFWGGMIRCLIGCASKLIVLTSFAKNLVEQSGFIGDIRVIPNPFRADVRFCRSKRSESIRQNEILIMGRLISGKGFLETIRAFSHLPNKFRLIVAGEGKLKSKIIRDIKALGIEDRVELKGWVRGAEKDLLLSRAAVFCLPSRVDSFGMSFIEAQCHDIPIVAFKHPPVMEVIQPGRAKFVESFDPKELAKAIEDANELNKQDLDGTGQVWVEKMFGIGAVTEKLKEILYDLPQ